MAERTCSVDGCDRQQYGGDRSGLCGGHRSRMYRTGSPGTSPVAPYGRSCSVEGCDKRHSSGGFCQMHLRRYQRHGDPLAVRPRERKRGPENPGWLDAPSYEGMHARVRRERGSAREYTCACGRPARHWAYDHGDPDEVSSDKGPLSYKTEHYKAMCVSCHKNLDLLWLGRRRTTTTGATQSSSASSPWRS